MRPHYWLVMCVDRAYTIDFKREGEQCFSSCNKDSWMLCWRWICRRAGAPAYYLYDRCQKEILFLLKVRIICWPFKSFLLQQNWNTLTHPLNLFFADFHSHFSHHFHQIWNILQCSKKDGSYSCWKESPSNKLCLSFPLSLSQKKYELP